MNDRTSIVQRDGHANVIYIDFNKAFDTVSQPKHLPTFFLDVFKAICLADFFVFTLSECIKQKSIGW
jgi:hypothetical protein